MIESIKVMSRGSMSDKIKNGSIPYISWYLISIHGPSRKLLNNRKIRKIGEIGCCGYLSLCFYDMTDSEHVSDDDKLFNWRQAKEIINFGDGINKGKDKSVLVIHCDGGISRSGAVSTFLNDYYGLNFRDFKKRNPKIKPNHYILRVLREESGLGINKENSMFNT